MLLKGFNRIVLLIAGTIAFIASVAAPAGGMLDRLSSSGNRSPQGESAAAPKGVDGILRRLTGLAANQRGTAALEFAFVGPALIAMLLAILYTSLVCLAQQMLETAAADAGRLLLTGAAQTSTLNGHTGMTAADFKNFICNGGTGTNANGESFTVPKLLPPLLSCSSLTVNVKTATSYNVSNGTAPTFTYDKNGVLTSTGTGYSTASAGSGQSRIVILQLVYLWPTLKGTFGLNLDNQPNANRMLVATSAFTTENYSCSASQTSC